MKQEDLVKYFYDKYSINVGKYYKTPYAVGYVAEYNYKCLPIYKSNQIMYLLSKDNRIIFCTDLAQICFDFVDKVEFIAKEDAIKLIKQRYENINEEDMKKLNL